MTKYILALDQGTTSSRAIIFDRQNKIHAVAQQEFKQYFPEAGWVEHDAEEIWDSQTQVIGESLRKAHIKSSEIAAIGVSNQRETTVMWNKKTGRPLHNAIVWQDRRTAPFIDELKAQGFQEKVQQKTGLILDAYFSASKLVWLLDNIQGARQQAENGELAFGTIDSWLIYKLTDGRAHITDVSNASRTMLFNIHTLGWDDDLLGLLNIPKAILPEVVPSSEVVAVTSEKVLDSEIPIAGIAGDQQAATFGQICFIAGQAKNTYGTGCFMVMNTGSAAKLSEHNLLTTVAWQRNSQKPDYALEGSVFIAGDAVRWLRDGLGLIKQASDIESLALSVKDNSGVYFVPAFAGLGAPHWDQYARGAIFGLTGGVTGAHLARALLEGIAFQVADVFMAVKNDSGIELEELRVDGGASKNNFLMQFQADVLGVPVVRPTITETTALGAAYLAGLAVGYWSGLEEIERLWSIEKRFEPQLKGSERERLYSEWNNAVERAKAWVPNN